MTGLTPIDGESAAELRTCLRDLVGLLGLPALWTTKEPQATSRLLAETLVEMLSLDACCITTHFDADRGPSHLLYVNGQPVNTIEEPGWQSLTEVRTKDHNVLSTSAEPTPIGTLRVARFSLGYYGSKGQICAAASRPDFPRQTELVLLRSAASLAASGLRTARLAYERERALRAKDEFLAMLGHELRNPLAPIVTALELLKAKRQALSQEHSVIERQVNHLKGLVDDLMDVTRITTGKVSLNQEIIELHTVVTSALDAAKPLIAQRRHTVTADVAAQGLTVRGDPVRLAQVISNLLINAAKYTEPEGFISVTACRDQKHIKLKITDNGIGIEPALLPHVFDLFEQGSVSMDRSRGGLGIGLSVAKSLVTLHGGTLSAASEGIGLGSTFTVSLPLAEDSVPVYPEEMSSFASTVDKAERILLVDDNHDAANVLAKLLRAYGHDVHVCYAPTDALMACTHLAPTLVIVDIGLPVINGYELAGLIRARLQSDPPRILAVTGYGQPQDRARSQQAGIEAHLTKPVAIQVLLQHINSKQRASEPSLPQKN